MIRFRQGSDRIERQSLRGTSQSNLGVRVDIRSHNKTTNLNCDVTDGGVVYVAYAREMLERRRVSIG